jgi:DNA-binding CsgD family transcriptional regulator
MPEPITETWSICAPQIDDVQQWLEDYGRAQGAPTPSLVPAEPSDDPNESRWYHHLPDVIAPGLIHFAVRAEMPELYFEPGLLTITATLFTKFIEAEPGKRAWFFDGSKEAIEYFVLLCADLDSRFPTTQAVGYLWQPLSYAHRVMLEIIEDRIRTEAKHRYREMLLSQQPKEATSQRPPEALQARVHPEGGFPELMPPDEPKNILSPRETEIAILLADGLSRQEIANKLIIGITTLRTHLKNISIKFGMQPPTESIARLSQEARRRGYGTRELSIHKKTKYPPNSPPNGGYTKP